MDIIKEKGLLLEKDVFDLLNNFEDPNLARIFLDNLEKASGQKMITSSVLSKNFQYVQEIVNTFPGEMKNRVEKVFVKMGINLEVKKETKFIDKTSDSKEGDSKISYQVFYSDTKNNKKVEFSDFVYHFRARYQEMQRILMQRPGLDDLVSINKISPNRQKVNIIGILTEKRLSKNKNLLLKFEDLTGTITTLVNKDSECFEKASEIQLDDIVAIKGSGNKDIIHVFDVIFPESFREKVFFDDDFSIAFISDIHVGSKKHLGSEFQKFINWLNKKDEVASKIKFIFIVGDNVDGVGVFPGQEKLIELKSFKEQYNQLANYLEQVPKDIIMFMCPGQHDCVRIAEPQPPISKFYAERLHKIENLILVPNPTSIKLFNNDKEFRVLMYHGGSIHAFINEVPELRLMKAHNCPAKAVKHMLKRRHLAPMHGVSPQIVYVPNRKKDPLLISEVPDILCTGEVHRLDIENYNGTIIITGSCWQAQTDFEEKVGNVPDPCKVPIFNLKSRELKVLDFSEDEDES